MKILKLLFIFAFLVSSMPSYSHFVPVIDNDIVSQNEHGDCDQHDEKQDSAMSCCESGCDHIHSSCHHSPVLASSINSMNHTSYFSSIFVIDNKVHLSTILYLLEKPPQ